MLKRYTILMILLAALFAKLTATASEPRLGSYPTVIAGVYQTTFTVWAGAATSVYVAGTFNRWNPQASPMTPLANGIWQTTLTGAKPGDLYKYVINGTIWKRDPRSSRVVHAGNTDSIIYDHEAYTWNANRFVPPKRDELVIYEVHVGTFNDTNPASPGSASLDDARAKLDHIAQLGANAVLLMPVNEFPGTHSWGYNPTDLFAVDNLTYGGPDALKRFVDAAHQRGIAVILDVVHNHYGTSNLPGDLEHSLWNFDGTHTNGGLYFYQDPRFAMTRWGPRPDYARPEVRTFIKDNIRMWLRDFRIDGIRWDATKFMRLTDDESMPIPDGITLIRELNDLMDEEFTNKISIAEDLAQLEETTNPTGTGGLGFDSDWHAGFHHAVTEEIARGASMDVGRLIHALAYPHHTRRMIYTESHDEAGHPDKGQVRVPVTMNPESPESYIARKKTLLAAGLLMTSPGIPMLLQGQEFLTTEPFHDIHPLDWDRTNSFSGIHAFFRDAIHLRANASGRSGALSLAGATFNNQHLPGSGNILTVHRPGSENPDDDFFLVANFTPEYFLEFPVIWPSEGNWHAWLNSDLRSYSGDFGDIGTKISEVGSSRVANISIAPWSMMLFSKSAQGPAFESITLAAIVNNQASNTVMQKNGRDRWIADIDLPVGANLRFKFFSATNGPLEWGAGTLMSDSWPATGNAIALPDGDWFEMSIVTSGCYRVEFNTASEAFLIRHIITALKQPIHTRVAVAANFNNYDPLALLNVQSDGRWSGDFIIQQATDARFKFTAYETMQASWGAHGSIHAGNPMHGIAVPGFSDDIVLAGPLDGRYRFTFDDATLEYTIERIGPVRRFESMAIAGNFNAWNIAPNMEQIGENEWRLVAPISYPENIEFKFVADNTWAFNWGQSHTLLAPSASIRQAKPDASNILLPGPVDDIYAITFNSDTLAYAVERLPGVPPATRESMAFAGSFNEWSIEPTMKLNDANEWTTDRLFRDPGEIRFKFVAEQSWASSWGAEDTPVAFSNHRTATGSRDISIAIPEPGVYRITFNDRNLTYRLERVDRQFMMTRIQSGAATREKQLVWPSVEGAAYAVYAATNLLSEFKLIADDLPARAPHNTFVTEMESETAQFFRIIEK